MPIKAPGALNEEELFYLLARGIPKSIAQQSLVAGFLNEVVARLNEPKIAAKIRELIEAKFAGR